MLRGFESEECNKFLKANNFSVVACTQEHPLLFSNWKYRKEITVIGTEVGDFKIFRVGDSATDLDK